MLAGTLALEGVRKSNIIHVYIFFCIKISRKAHLNEHFEPIFGYLNYEKRTFEIASRLKHRS